MNMTRTLRPPLTLLPLFAAMLLLAGCGFARPRDTEPPLANSDSSALVEQVTATVEARLSQRVSGSAGAGSAANTEAIIAQVLQKVQAPAQEAIGLAKNDATAAAPSSTNSSDLEQTLIQVYNRSNPAVVYIIVPSLGSGSGFVYDNSGHIVTNNHVVDGGDSYEIVFADGARRSATLVGRDVDSDLAVLRVDDIPKGVEPLSLAQPGQLQVGQFVVAIGNPFGEQGSMSLGIVSGLDRSLRSRRSANANPYSLPEVIQTDAPINPGNSGGPLLNLDAEVVGVNSAIATTTGANSGVGFSIPVAAVRRIVPSLIAGGSYDYPYLGISFADEISLSEQAALDLPQTQGAYVLGVASGSPADRAGIIAADPNSGRGGDLIVQIDSQPIIDFSDLNGYLVFNTAVGQKLTIKLLRQGKPVTLTLTLGARP